MNRRNFLSAVGALATGFTILPSAKTYARIWKEIAKTSLPKEALINPEWMEAPYEIAFYYDKNVYEAVEAISNFLFRMTKDFKVVTPFIE